MINNWFGGFLVGAVGSAFLCVHIAHRYLERELNRRDAERIAAMGEPEQIRQWRKCAPSTATDHPKLPHVPPMTATWPARNIEVNGFRYVLDEKEQGR